MCVGGDKKKQIKGLVRYWSILSQVCQTKKYPFCAIYMTPFCCQIINSSYLCKEHLYFPRGSMFELEFVIYTCKIQLFLFSGSYIYLGGLNAGHQGSSLCDHRKTTGFGPFKLPTHSLLQTGRDHSPPKAFLRSPALPSIWNTWASLA